ncbi:MAG: cell envelope integrity protein TolA [Arenicellales bacterium]|nr:cell envelope integrity protein TolA [Arenicellales bacterium]
MNRSAPKMGRPLRGFILAVVVHVAFGALLGVSLRLQPEVVKPIYAEPVQAVVVDLAAIAQEKKRKTDALKKKKAAEKKKKADALQKKKAAEKKEKAEELKKKKAAEKKKNAEELKKKKAEALKKKKAAEKKKKAAEKKKKAEALKKKKAAEKKKKAEALKKKKAAEKKKKEEALKKKKAAEKKKKAEAKRKAEEQKRKAEAEKKRKAREKREREAAERKAAKEALARDERDAGSALGALVGAIEEKVRSNWSLPGEFTGLAVTISVKVTRTGEVTLAEIVRSSGNSLFDESAVTALMKASPLPFPEEPRYYEFIKEFHFVLRAKN